MNKVTVPIESVEDWKLVESFLEKTYHELFEDNSDKSAQKLSKLLRKKHDSMIHIFKKLESAIHLEYRNKIDLLSKNEKDSDHKRQRDKEESIIANGGKVYYRVYLAHRPANGSYGFNNTDKEVITEYGICTSFKEAVMLANKYDDEKVTHDFNWTGEKYLWRDPTSQWSYDHIYIAIHLTLENGEVK